ncbi:MAG: heparan N-sulfatase, partial [Verrucomicrobiota bacterium]
DAVVQYADILPTLLDAGGGTVSEGLFDGSSFLSVLKDPSQSHRAFAYGMHNNIPEGPPYPIRTVTDGTFRYIRNLRPNELYIEKHLMGDGRLNNPYWASWLAGSAHDPKTYRLVKRYMTRPAEELYRTADDPFEQTNLAREPEHAAVKKRLSDELDRWMTSQGDPGIEQDTQKAIQAARKGKHLYHPPE